MFLLLVEMKGMLDLVTDALALWRLCVAVTTVLLLVHITSSTTLSTLSV